MSLIPSGPTTAQDGEPIALLPDFDRYSSGGVFVKMGGVCCFNSDISSVFTIISLLMHWFVGTESGTRPLCAQITVERDILTDIIPNKFGMENRMRDERKGSTISTMTDSR